MELLQKTNGSQVTYVPYRGAAESSTAAVAGQIDLSLNFAPAVIGTIQDGLLRGLAVTALQRSKQLPDIPTVRTSKNLSAAKSQSGGRSSRRPASACGPRP